MPFFLAVAAGLALVAHAFVPTAAAPRVWAWGRALPVTAMLFVALVQYLPIRVLFRIIPS